MAGLVRRFKPLFDRILVQRLVADTKTKGGVLLPEKSMGKMMEATVVAIGDGARDRDGKVVPLSVGVGDKVLLPEYGGTKVEFDEKEYYIFRDQDLLGKFES
ncbi:10 kDa heat shock protein, mitochondrial-like [Rhopilema esculentum]|uniref:10 kDa heat shock protein, mitochondrial-like n=1 Tax=Rhopilema esculentum TaxID=499914 RepID=UPI0031DA501E